MRKILLLFAAIAVLSSCTITKRHYAPGYHVDWKSMNATQNQNRVPLTIETSNENKSVVANLETVEISTVNHHESIEHAYPVSHMLDGTNLEMQDMAGNDIDPKGFVNQGTKENALEDEEYPLNSIEILTDTLNDPISTSPDLSSNTRVNRKAIWGLILSAIGLPGFVLSGVGVLLCALALDEIKKNGGRGKVLAKIGIAIPATIAAIIVLWFIVLMIALVIEQGIS